MPECRFFPVSRKRLPFSSFWYHGVLILNLQEEFLEPPPFFPPFPFPPGIKIFYASSSPPPKIFGATMIPLDSLLFSQARRLLPPMDFPSDGIALLLLLKITRASDARF